MNDLYTKFREYIKNNFEPGDALWSFEAHFKKNVGFRKFNVDSPLVINCAKIKDFFQKEHFDKNKDVNWLNQEGSFIQSFMEQLSNDDYALKEMVVIPPISDEFKNTGGKYTIYKIALKVFLEGSKKHIFYAREFDNKFTLTFYKEFEKKINSNFNMPVVMLEDDPKSGNINNRIFNEIKNCAYFIADLTYRNTTINNNVMYEIGLAHAFGKKTLLIMHESVYPFGNESIKNLPFDINIYTVIKYKDANDLDDIIKVLESEQLGN